ncbi:probable serine hydrolase [Hetaerina americana]|uniref:probable serine hydrolase n=1 Tax=Hetaerina americana TaxID=62018 RepID=UPI003A7F5872
MRQLIARFPSMGVVLPRKRQLCSSSRLFCMDYQNSAKYFEDITIPIPWGNVSGKWWGAANVQPILAVHGWEDNAGSFDELAPLLVSENSSFLAIDLPGHGKSSHVPLGTTYNFMDGVTLIRQIVKHYNWDKITLIGHSYGSKVTFTYSAFFPNNVLNLIGIDCARAEIIQTEDNVAQGLRTAIESALYLEEKIAQKKPPAYSMAEMIQLMQTASKGPFSKKCCEAILKRGAKESYVKGKYYFSRDPRLKALPFGRLSEEMLFACASRISCNVLQLNAKPGWGFGQSEAHGKTLELMEMGARRFEHYFLEGTHHFHLDTPEQVASVVKKFLES